MDAVLTLTLNPTVDIGAQVRVLEPDRKLRSSTARYEAGGGGVNIARAIRRLGGEVRALFPAGGGLGQMLEELLAAEGVAHERVPIEGMTRASFAVRVKEPGQLFHFVLPGPELAPAEVDACLRAVTDCEPCPRYLAASGSLPPGVGDDFFARLARICHERDIRLLLDTHGDPLRLALEEQVYLIKPNRHEFAELTGRQPGDEAALRDCARQVVTDGGVEALIVTLGDQGALLTTEHEQVRARPPRVESVSPVGAGDSFLALCAYQLAAGGSLRDALCYGVAAAAAAVRSPGTELFRKEDLQELHSQVEQHTETVASDHG